MGQGMLRRGWGLRSLCLVVLALASGTASAEVILLDMPSYTDGAPVQNMGPVYTGDPYATAAASRDYRPILGGNPNPLFGQPQYVWWYGCSPTSGGMMVGYWDVHGYPNLYNGNAGTWTGNGNSGTRRMVASTAHITSGAQNGYTYGDYNNSTSYPTHVSNPDCVADFMQTVDGGSWSPQITSGLANYIGWNGAAYGNPNWVTKGSYSATTTNTDVPIYGGTFTYNSFKAQVAAGRPVLLNLETYAPGEGWVGHSVVGYGYQDNMFQIKVSNGAGGVNMTVGGFAIMDTWTPGTTYQSDWYNWAGGVVGPTIVGGVEWWPFVESLGWSWTSRWDWMVTDAVTLQMNTAPCYSVTGATVGTTYDPAGFAAGGYGTGGMAPNSVPTGATLPMASFSLDSPNTFATLKVSYDPTYIASLGLDEASLCLYWLNGQTWVPGGTTTAGGTGAGVFAGVNSNPSLYGIGYYGVDTLNDFIWANINHASTYSTAGLTFADEGIPEPATLTLLAFAGLGLLARRRRTGRAAA